MLDISSNELPENLRQQAVAELQGIADDNFDGLIDLRNASSTGPRAFTEVRGWLAELVKSEDFNFGVAYCGAAPNGTHRQFLHTDTSSDYETLHTLGLGTDESYPFGTAAFSIPYPETYLGRGIHDLVTIDEMMTPVWTGKNADRVQIEVAPNNTVTSLNGHRTPHSPLPLRANLGRLAFGVYAPR